mmetsp:Transcript_5699/g.18056  ORF Transcript_5699/g.18056 Transcript_5699/m.18056 type:complete len:219 (+) Transcript_5699:352-1008(+)
MPVLQRPRLRLGGLVRQRRHLGRNPRRAPNVGVLNVLHVPPFQKTPQKVLGTDGVVAELADHGGQQRPKLVGQRAIGVTGQLCDPHDGLQAQVAILTDEADGSEHRDDKLRARGALHQLARRVECRRAVRRKPRKDLRRDLAREHQVARVEDLFVRVRVRIIRTALENGLHGRCLQSDGDDRLLVGVARRRRRLVVRLLILLLASGLASGLASAECAR